MASERSSPEAEPDVRVRVYTLGRISLEVDGTITPLPGSPYLAGTEGRYIAIDPTGRYLYVANGGSNNVSGFSIDRNTGALTPVSGSPFAAQTGPVAIAIHPDGGFLYAANAASDSISGYRLDLVSGALSALAGSPFAAGDGPRSLAINPAGTHLYVVNRLSNDLWTFTIDPITGALAAAPGSPVGTGVDPRGVELDPTGRFALWGGNGHDAGMRNPERRRRQLNRSQPRHPGARDREHKGEPTSGVMRATMRTQPGTAAAVSPDRIRVELACGHRGSFRSPYAHTVSPRALEDYAGYLGTTRCAECRDALAAPATDENRGHSATALA